MSSFSRSLVLAFLIVAAQSANADPIVGTATGIFLNPVPLTAVVGGVGTNHFTYGTPNPPGSPPNSLDFSGASISSMTGASFKVGTLTYFNGGSNAGTTPDTVQLKITLGLSSPVATPSFTYLLQLISTTNTSDPDASADYVRLGSLPSQESFLYNGRLYTLNLTGFQNVVGDGFLASSSSELHVRENLRASADIFGTVQLAAVPGPSAALVFLPAALSRARRRRQKV